MPTRKKKIEDVGGNPAQEMETPKKRPRTAVGIDMTHVPESLLREGYKEEDTKQARKIPDALICPVCKELFVNAEMLHCGHTVCGMCIEGTQTHVCPVCKDHSYSKTIPNYIVKQLVEEQYAEEVKVRAEKVAEIQELKKKLDGYIFSDRFVSIGNHFARLMDEWYFLSYKTAVEHIMKFQVDPPVKEEEALYFLACKAIHGLSFVGEFIFKKTDHPDTLMQWLETQKGRKQPEIKKWLPILVMVSTRPLQSHDQWCRLAKVCKMDIGSQITTADLKNHPAYWVKDLKLVVSFPGYHHCGHPHHFHDDEEIDFSDEYYSDSDSD